MIDYNKPVVTIAQYYATGLGEQLWYTSMAVSLGKYIKDTHDIQVKFCILPHSNSSLSVIDVVNNIYNISLLQSLFDEVVVEWDDDLYANDKSDKFARMHVGGLDSPIHGHPGAWSVYTPHQFSDYIASLDIPYDEFFDPRWPKNRKHRYFDVDIFSAQIIKEANAYIDMHLPKNFESIYYRAIGMNYKMLDDSIKLIPTCATKEQPYFVCSNWNLFKKKLIETDIDCKFYRSIEEHGDRMPNGLSLDDRAVSDAVIAMVEMYIMSKSSKIHVAIERDDPEHGGLFLWYPNIIRNVPVDTVRYLQREDEGHDEASLANAH